MALKDLFALAGTISVDSSGAIKNIDKATDAAKQSESKFESSFKNIARAAVTYLSVTAIWNFGKQMVEAAAEVQAETAQFDAAFQDLSDSAKDAFGRIEESTGTLSTRLQVVGTKAFSQFKGSGMEATDALANMEEYLNLAADGAAYYDMSLEETDSLLRSFIRGNTEAGDRLGLFTSETQRNTAAQDKYGKKFLELTEAQKQLLMLDIAKGIYDASGATGQAAREADGYANVVGNLKEQWRQFLAQAGAPILEALIPILKSLGGLLEKIAPVLTVITTFIADIFTFLSENVWLLEAITAGLIAMATAYGIWTIATKAQATAQKLLNLVMTASPITWIILGIGLLVAAFVTLWNKCEGFRNFWKNAWEAIKNVAKAVWEAIKGFFVGAWNAIKAVWNGVKSFFVNIWNGIKNTFNSVVSFFKNIFTGAVNGIKNAFRSVGTFFANIWNGIKNGAKACINGIITIFETGINAIVSLINGITGALSSIWTWTGLPEIPKIPKAKLPRLAKGAVVDEATPAIFGEDGEEAILPLEKNTEGIQKIANLLYSKMSGAGNIANYGEYKSAVNFIDYRPEINNIYEVLSEYLPTLAKLKVVLSTGETVGALTPYMDKALGERSAKKERGRV